VRIVIVYGEAIFPGTLLIGGILGECATPVCEAGSIGVREPLLRSACAV
jgi:hypothetical protein